MANLYIAEYSNLALNGHAPIPQEPALATQKIAFTTSAASAAFNVNTRFIRLVSDADCSITFGATPTATTSHQFLSAEAEYWRGVAAGSKVAAVANP